MEGEKKWDYAFIGQNLHLGLLMLTSKMLFFIGWETEYYNSFEVEVYFFLLVSEGFKYL